MVDKQTIIRYTVSTAVTFVAGFAAVIAVEAPELTVESFSNGAALGVLLAATRAGAKVAWEVASVKLIKILKK